MTDSARIYPFPDERGAVPLSWDTAFETCYAELCEYVLRFVGSADLAEDLVQDLFLELWKSQSQRDPTRLTRAYLFVSARNRALQNLRHRKVVDAWIDRVSREEVPTAASPSELCLEQELGEAVAAAIAELPVRCRRVFLLRRRDQLSWDEIVERTGLSIATVKSHIFRATVMLRDKLAPYLAVAFALWIF